MIEPERVEAPERVEPVEPEDRIAALYGPEAVDEWRALAGVVHVAAVWLVPAAAPAREPELAAGEWRTILIRPDSPRSDADRFALELARARADAIVVTGRILRDEPALAYAAPGFGLSGWRRRALGREQPPRLLILTGRATLDPAHPALHGWARPVVYTRLDRADALRARLPDHVEVVAAAAPSLASAVAWLRADGCAVVSIEAGPSTTNPVYAEPDPWIDELCVSELLGDLPEHLRGPSFADRARILARLTCRSRVEVVEPSGVWRISRYTRS